MHCLCFYVWESCYTINYLTFQFCPLIFEQKDKTFFPDWTVSVIEFNCNNIKLNIEYNFNNIESSILSSLKTWDERLDYFRSLIINLFKFLNFLDFIPTENSVGHFIFKFASFYNSNSIHNTVLSL